MNYPIVFIHKGNSWYLPYTLWQCRQTNPGREIYLIGNKETIHFSSFLNHVDINEFRESGSELQSCYRHLSELGADFELPCIERWFILRDFLKQRSFENCLYLDSDILVFEDIEKYARMYSQFDMTWCSFSAHSNFVSNVSALDNYCKLVLTTYQTGMPAQIETDSLYCSVTRGNLKMNISDMTFFHDYNLLYPNSLLAIDRPDKEGTFDISMEETRIFKPADDSFKKIVFDGQRPKAQLRSSGELIPMVTLHFQGKAKTILKRYFKYPSSRFYLLLLKNSLSLTISKLKRKLL